MPGGLQRPQKGQPVLLAYIVYTNMRQQPDACVHTILWPAKGQEVGREVKEDEVVHFVT